MSSASSRTRNRSCGSSASFSCELNDDEEQIPTCRSRASQSQPTRPPTSAVADYTQGSLINDPLSYTRKLHHIDGRDQCSSGAQDRRRGSRRGARRRARSRLAAALGQAGVALVLAVKQETALPCSSARPPPGRDRGRQDLPFRGCSLDFVLVSRALRGRRGQALLKVRRMFCEHVLNSARITRA